MKKLILTLCAVFVTMMSFAQYTFISNSNYHLNFYKAYLDVPIVKKASLANGKISNEMLDYICKKANPADVKYALINALGCNGKMSENDEVNHKTISSYFDTNYDSGMTFNDILRVLGSSTAMSMALINAYTDWMYTEEALENAKKVNKKEYNDSRTLQSTLIMTQLIAIEYSMGFVGDVTPMGTQEGFIESVKDILGMCKYAGDAEGVSHDMRKSAFDMIYNCLKEFDMEVGKIKIISKSSNPYQVSINGKVIGNTEPYEVYIHQCSPGYYHIKAVQVSGYAFSPTVNNRDVNVEDGETVTVTIGYED
ncbi:MAG: hypothetical protein II939_03785 [Bacteroidales bacterium]|nr:hypothetical protein [Bacteroidales bacterium]